ncbi:mitochondrial ATPase complex subunit ATP10, partial [Viridothelium virens]
PKPPPPNPQALEYRTSDRNEKSETLEDVLNPKSDDHNPHLLGRPIGMPFPPSPGENSGKDTRPMRERFATTFNKEHNQQRRRELRHAFQKPYFRDWSNMKWHEGKTFHANPRLFRRDRGLWFPNFVGETLVPGSSREESTTEVLRGKVSVVCVYSSEWAYQQVDSFVGKKQNPEVREVLEMSGNVAQRVDVNVEESLAKYWILRPFFARLRKGRRKEDYGRYFVVRKGITDQIRESIGLLNSKVGYVYLVDVDCKIRWAGSGPSWPEERETIVKGLQKMILEAR